MRIYSTSLKIILLIIIILSTNLSAEIEPNDNYQQANTIGPNANDSGTLTAATDEYDWWKVTLPSDGSLFVEAIASGGLTDIELHIYDTDGTTQISYLDISTGVKENTHKSNLKAGTYYIRAARYSGSGSYTIRTVFTAALYDNDTESNDTYQTALLLGPNAETTGHIGYYGSNSTDYYDWYKITLPSDGSLKAHSESDSADVELHLYDVDGTSQISSLDISTGLIEETHKNNLMAGTYYLRAALYNKYGGYRLTTTFVPSAIEGITTLDTEPNNSSATAQTLANFSGAGSITTYGHIGYYYNKVTDWYDWWSVSFPEDGRLVITTISNETLDLDMYIYSPDGANQISSLDISTGINEQTHHDKLGADTYYIRVNNYSGYGAYKITAEYTPTSLPNDIEPNNEITTPISIGTNVVKTGHLGYYYNGDGDYYDFYTFTLSSKWDSLYVRTDSDSTLEVDLTLYNGAKSPISSAGAYGTREILKYSNIEAGTYYIRAADYSGYGSYGIKITSTYPSNPATAIDEKEISKLPDNYTLYQNYPNPFNPETTIKYDIPQKARVTLKVFDILGNEVATLVNRELEAGRYSVNFNAGMLSSGVYFYRISTDEFSQTKKFIVMK